VRGEPPPTPTTTSEYPRPSPPPPTACRETLVERGLTRADIGDIASKIGQLYYSLYLRTSKPGAILEAYVFYEAIHARAYFDEQSSGGMAEAVKALKFYARFIIVCLLINKKEVRGL
jgi:hypothetical protein